MQEIANAIVRARRASNQEQQPAVLAWSRKRDAPACRRLRAELRSLAAAQAAAIDGIRVPTLLVTGDQDGVAPPQRRRPMAERIQAAAVGVFEGCGHWTTFEKPQACMQELQHFHAGVR
jgi:pimeloyl-ACP methyl ester carboxylesterase